MRISLIAALAENRVIGMQNRLPWRLPADLRRFRELTRGHAVIMGRKTYESVGRLLPDRQNIILTRQRGWNVPGALIVSTVDQALAASVAGEREVFVIGGGEIYREFLSHADRLYLTWVDAQPEGDAFFPEWPSSEFREVESLPGPEEPGQPSYRFVILDRVGAIARASESPL